MELSCQVAHRMAMNVQMIPHAVMTWFVLVSLIYNLLQFSLFFLILAYPNTV